MVAREKEVEITHYYEGERKRLRSPITMKEAITLLSSLQNSHCIIKPTEFFQRKKKLSSQPGFEPMPPN